MPSLLDAGVISALGAVVAANFVDSFEVLRQGAPAPDGYGGQRPGAITVTSSGNCLLKAITSGSAESLIAGRLSLTRPAIIDLPVGVDLKETDQVRINTTRTFEVSLVVREGGYAVKTTAIVEEKS